MLDELRNMRPLGTIRTLDSPGHDRGMRTRPERTMAVVASSLPLTGRLNSGKYVRGLRPVDGSLFTVIQMYIDAEGRGTGTLSIATKIRAHDDISIALEDLASCRVMLTEILAGA